MTNPLTILTNPLIRPETRWSSARRWVFWMRWAAGTVLMLTLLCVIWIWWLLAMSFPGYPPGTLLYTGAFIIEVVWICAALLLGPAALAGTIAGEKSQGSLGLLLTTRVSPGEIVWSRLVSRYSQIAMVLAGGIPAMWWIVAPFGVPIGNQLLLASYPFAVAFGGAGIALGLSALAKRGRDALLVGYCLVMIPMVLPTMVRGSVPAAVATWLDLANPIARISGDLAGTGLLPGILLVSCWLLVGVLGAVVAAHCLRPRRQRAIKKAAPSKDRPTASSKLIDQPMLWKEMYIERTTVLGWFGRAIGVLTVVALFAGSLILFGWYAWFEWIDPQPSIADEARSVIESTVGVVQYPLSWIIQLAIALRAALTVSSERERDTWDNLLLTLLDGRDIVSAKIKGCLHALRWLLLGGFVFAVMAVLCSAIEPMDFAALTCRIMVLSVFSAAAGVWMSLSSATTNRAMTMTIMVWFGALFVVEPAALILISILMLWWFLGWLVFALFGWANYSAGPSFPMGFETAWFFSRYGCYLLAAFLISLNCRRRFDVLAGRRHLAPLTLGEPGDSANEPADPVGLSVNAVSEQPGAPTGTAID